MADAPPKPAAPVAEKRLFPVLWRVPAAWRLVRAKDAKAWEKLLVVAAALYVVMPFDAITDFAPIIGWLDDAGVVAVVAAVLNRALHRYAAAPVR
jgi:uncharacterized membrane protein YkvA (DUF1232 family)